MVSVSSSWSANRWACRLARVMILLQQRVQRNEHHPAVGDQQVGLRTVDRPAQRRGIAFNDDRSGRRVFHLLPLVNQLIQLEPRFRQSAGQVEVDALGAVELPAPLLESSVPRPRPWWPAHRAAGPRWTPSAATARVSFSTRNTSPRRACSTAISFSNSFAAGLAAMETLTGAFLDAHAFHDYHNNHDAHDAGHDVQEGVAVDRFG